MKTDEKKPHSLHDRELTEKDEAIMFGNGPETPAEGHSNEAVKGVAWLFGIVAVFAVAILLTWIIGSNSPFSDRGADRQSKIMEYAYNASHNKSQPPMGSNPAQKANYQFMAVLIPTNAQTGLESAKSSEASKPATPISTSDQDRIEREAREVIHGDFGDNPERKAKLGADYEAVQARVNEILH